MPYMVRMHAVVETQNYLASAKAEGMTDVEMERVVDLLSLNPTAGDLIVGSGGCRKVRVAGKGKGKSGGYRVLTFYAQPDRPVYLLSVLSKSSRANFSDGEIAAMKQVTKTLQAEWNKQ